MNILIYCRSFHPAVGGVETLAAILSDEFSRQGHEVRLITQTPANSNDTFRFTVVRRPSALGTLSLVRWCDIYFHPQLSLKGAWPLLLVRRPWVVSHNTWYTRTNGKVAWQDRLKQFLSTYAENISVSAAIAAHVSAPSTVVHNTYRDAVFRLIEGVPRERQLIFVGRLVSDKGGDLLLRALSVLRGRGLTPQLSIAGSGPEESSLRDQAQALGVRDQVTFLGTQTGTQLARALNAHCIIVVPSRWEEPFGIVALEGIACGCVVVAAAGGGLPAAVGPCGLTFPRNDVEALADCIGSLLLDPKKVSELRAGAASHLVRHDKGYIAGQYLEVFRTAVGRRFTAKVSN